MGLAALAAYAALLAVLVLAERGAPAATIRSLGDAFWYSLVTLTTVGYGDLYPVSAAGRLAGAVFVMLSLGILASLVALAAGTVREWAERRRERRKLRRLPCCLFSERNEASETLAENLLADGEKKCMVFCGAEAETPAPASGRILCLSRGIEQIAPFCGDLRGVFLMGAEEAGNAVLAERMRGGGAPVFCRGAELKGMDGVRFFDDMECCARAYWRKWPLRDGETRIWIAGDGKLAQALLDQAVLVNCRTPFRRTVYHLFGDWRAYRRMHPGLRQVFSDTEEGTRDALIFHETGWMEEPELAARADRVIFCADSRKANGESAAAFSRYIASPAVIHLAGEAPGALGEGFGAPGEIFTADTVIRGLQDRRARALHRAYCRLSGRETPWEELSPFLKASNRAAADHLETKIRLLVPDWETKKSPEDIRAEAAERLKRLADWEMPERNEHERWSRFYALYNWKWGPEKDEALRTHPDLVPYEELSPGEREKDRGAWRMLEARLPEEEDPLPRASRGE